MHSCSNFLWSIFLLVPTVLLPRGSLSLSLCSSSTMKLWFTQSLPKICSLNSGLAVLGRSTWEPVSTKSLKFHKYSGLTELHVLKSWWAVVLFYVVILLSVCTSDINFNWLTQTGREHENTAQTHCYLVSLIFRQNKQNSCKNTSCVQPTSSTI